jgi:nucleoside phosphorylase
MHVDLEPFKGKIDFGVISIRQDEFIAVLKRFAPDQYAMGSQRYEIGTLRTNDGGYYNFAAVRCPEQGQGLAQKVATDLIRDLEPRWLLVVGIGGAVPSRDFTLGDVVCAMRVHDFSVRAVKEGALDTYSAGGGPMHAEILRLLGSLPAIAMRELGEWNSPEALGTPKPTLRVPGTNSDRYYGDVTWKAELRRALLYHFPKGRPPRPPLVTSGPVATSDALVKSTALLSQWQEYARGVAAVEMELGGVFLAARQIDREYPILAIRGISDIVGLKREEQWTKYACSTAAAFAYALLCAGAPFKARVSPAPLEAPLTSLADRLREAAEICGRFANHYRPGQQVDQSTKGRTLLQGRLGTLKSALETFTNAELEACENIRFTALVCTHRDSILDQVSTLRRINVQGQDIEIELRQLVASLIRVRNVIQGQVSHQEGESRSRK